MVPNIKKVLVTGGAGFIGSHVVDELLRAGYQIRVMDNLGPPTHNGTLPDWFNKQAEFFLGDVRRKVDWEQALVGIDAVAHLASYMDYHLDFSNYVRSNIESIVLLYELIVEKKLPIQKIISASSQSVYGEGKYRCATHGEVYPPPRPDEQLKSHRWEMLCPECGSEMQALPEDESDRLLPQISYGISKLSSEHFMFNLGRRYNVPTTALRFSIALGARQSFRHFYSGALRAFAVRALSHEPMQINEDGNQVRDLVSVRDVARAHRVVLESSAANFQSFNVGRGEGTKIIDLAKIVAAETGEEFNPLVGATYRVGDGRNSLMNVEKLKSLGWRPEVTLSEMVKEYITWIKQQGDVKQYLEKTYQEMAKDGILKTDK